LPRETAFGIDSRIDHGNFVTGNVRASVSTCTTTTNRTIDSAWFWILRCTAAALFLPGPNLLKLLFPFMIVVLAPILALSIMRPIQFNRTHLAAIGCR